MTRMRAHLETVEKVGTWQVTWPPVQSSLTCSVMPLYLGVCDGIVSLIPLVLHWEQWDSRAHFGVKWLHPFMHLSGHPFIYLTIIHSYSSPITQSSIQFICPSVYPSFTHPSLNRLIPQSILIHCLLIVHNNMCSLTPNLWSEPRCT